MENGGLNILRTIDKKFYFILFFLLFAEKKCLLRKKCPFRNFNLVNRIFLFTNIERFNTYNLKIRNRKYLKLYSKKDL